MTCSATWPWELCKISEVLRNGCYEMIYLRSCKSKKHRSPEPTEKLAQEACEEEGRQAQPTRLLSACFTTASFSCRCGVMSFFLFPQRLWRHLSFLRLVIFLPQMCGFKKYFWLVGPFELGFVQKACWLDSNIKLMLTETAWDIPVLSVTHFNIHWTHWTFQWYQLRDISDGM